jgi:uncharacterized protein (TIGR02271 family)
MITQNDIQRLFGADVYEQDGGKIGSAGQVYLDNRSGEPEWLTVKTGLFGTKESFVPLRQATVSEDRVVVPFSKDRIKDAPRIDADGNLSPEEEEQLYRYYGLGSTDTDTGRGTENITDPSTDRYAHSDRYTAESRDTTGTDRSYVGTERSAGHDTSGPNTDDAMTRSEERLVAGTRTEDAGRARLRKYVVTEQQQVNVPVSREEVRLEREPITDANVGRAMDGPAITEEQHEVTLRAERPVVETEAVPVERVRLGKETVTDTESVQGEVRKEQIDYDGPEGRNRS